jgi:hypothetical protein
MGSGSIDAFERGLPRPRIGQDAGSTDMGPYISTGAPFLPLATYRYDLSVHAARRAASTRIPLLVGSALTSGWQFARTRRCRSCASSRANTASSFGWR